MFKPSSKLPSQGCSETAGPSRASAGLLWVPPAFASSPVSLRVDKRPRPWCCQEKMSPAAVLLLQTEEGRFLCRTKKVPRVCEMGGGWLGSELCFAHWGCCWSLRLDGRGEVQLIPTRCTSPDPNPAEQTPNSAGSAPRAPLAVPTQPGVPRQGLIVRLGTRSAPHRAGVTAVSLVPG